MRTKKQIKKYLKKYQRLHYEELRKKRKIYELTHKKEIDKIMKLYRKRNRIKLIKYLKLYYKTHKKDLLLKAKKYYKKIKNKVEYKNYCKQYYQNRKKITSKKMKAYYLKNKEKILEKVSKYILFRLKKDTKFKLTRYLRARIYSALKGFNKSESTEKLIGCSIQELKLYIENQFKPGMSWSNYGKWHIDHIKPCASFDLSKPEEQKKCFHYTNLQPLWAEENLRKSDNYEKK
jgi:hypothetical protein